MKGADIMVIRFVDIVETSRHIKKLCTEKGYGASEIQKHLRLQSVQSVYSWWSVKSKNIPGLDHLLQLSDLLGCSLEELLVLKRLRCRKRNRAEFYIIG